MLPGTFMPDHRHGNRPHAVTGIALPAGPMSAGDRPHDRRLVRMSVASVLRAVLEAKRVARAPDGSVCFRLQVADPATGTRTSAGELDPYAAELIADELRVGRVECFVTDATAALLGVGVRRRIAALRARGVDVLIH